MKFVMYTDHKPLLGLFAEDCALPTHAAARVLRWVLTLSRYNYELKYRPGEEHEEADFLRNGEASFKVASVALMELAHAPVTEKEVREHSQKDPLWSRVIRLVLKMSQLGHT